MITRNLYLIASIAIISAAPNLYALPIAPGDILVYQTRNDPFSLLNNAAPVSILDINPQTSTLIQSFSLSTQSSPLYSTTADPIANLALSNHGTQLSFVGWTTKGSINPLGESHGIPRGVGTLSSDGTYAQPATYNPATLSVPDQPHAAFSPDGVNWYFGDTSGMYYNNGTTPLTNSDATLSIKGFGTTTYALHTLSSNFLPPIGSDSGLATAATALSIVTPATPGPSVTSITYTPVVTLPAGAHDFALVSSFNQAPDTLYVTTSTGISKYSGFGSNWTFEGTDPLTGATSITALDIRNVGVELFVTVNTGSLQTISSSLDEIMDSFPGTTPATINPSAPVILYTAPALGSLQGVSLAPTPEPATLAITATAALITLMRRRPQ